MPEKDAAASNLYIEELSEAIFTSPRVLKWTSDLRSELQLIERWLDVVFLQQQVIFTALEQLGVGKQKIEEIEDRIKRDRKERENRFYKKIKEITDPGQEVPQ